MAVRASNPYYTEKVVNKTVVPNIDKIVADEIISEIVELPETGDIEASAEVEPPPVEIEVKAEAVEEVAEVVEEVAEVAEEAEEVVENEDDDVSEKEVADAFGTTVSADYDDDE